MKLDTTVSTAGWDIGGANIKAARFRRRTAGESPGEDLLVVQRPFAIWQKRDRLVDLLIEMADQLGPADRVGVTITAELSDAFRTKREGIAFVIDAVQAAMPASAVWLFGVDGRFHPLATGYRDPLLFAAANWMAMALLTARHCPDCLLVDVGSTTTDIIPIVGGAVVARGSSDPARLLQGELLYTGALRTTVPAIVQHVPLWGGWCPVAAEHFATAQDVHLLLGNLPPAAGTSPTADGRPATLTFARERLARVVCADMEMLSNADIESIARHIAGEQINQIVQAINSQLEAQAAPAGPLVAVGVGDFLVEAVAARLDLPYQKLSPLLNRRYPFDTQASLAAPAAAVAILLAERS